jgi:hypothetical protein
MSTWKARRLGFETLESRRYLSAGPFKTDAPTSDVVAWSDLNLKDLPHAEGDLDDPAYVHTLTPPQYRMLSNTQVRLLSETQIRGLTANMIIETNWPGRSYLSSTPETTGFSPQQIGWLNVANHNIPFVFLNPAQLPYLTSTQVATLTKVDFFTLPAALVQHLTRPQIETVSDTEFSNNWTLASRTGLTQTQIPWLTMGNRKIFWLTPEQRPWLTPQQIAAVEINELPLVPASLVPHIPTSRLAQIHDRNFLGSWKAANLTGFNALTQTQIQSLDVSSGQLFFLSPEQRAMLSPAQVAQVALSELHLIPASLVPHISTDTLAQIHDRNFLGNWKFLNLAGFNALTQTQLQSLDVSSGQLFFLSPEQRAMLSPTQVATVALNELYLVPASLVPHITTDQLAQIPNAAFLGDWKFRNLAGFNALTQTQIQSLDVSNGQLTFLSPEQRALLSATQLGQVPLTELQLIPASLVPLIPTSRLAQIHDRMILGNWAAANPTGLAALTELQIQALDLTDNQFIFLTPAQRLWITVPQLAMLKFSEWRNDANNIYLTPEQISRVPLSTLAAFEYPEVKLRAITPLQQSGLTREQLLIAGHGTPGDFDGDGAIDASDLPVWVRNAGMTSGATKAQGDANGDGAVNGNDFLKWQQRLGKTPGADLWSNFTIVEVTQKAPVGTYTPAVDIPLSPEGISLSPHMAMERDALFALAPAGFETHAAVASGDWTNPATWAGGAVPGAGAKVLIPAGITVRYDANSSAALQILRVNGTLTFAHDANTLLVVDTLIVHTYGTLHIGTEEQPIGDEFEARILFPVDTDIDAVWDPTLVSRGLLSRGQVRMFGRTVTPFVELLVEPVINATQLVLAQTPTNWEVGDKIVIAGTVTNHPTFGAEERRIVSIVGNVITIDQGLTFAHQSPAGFGLKVHVANVERNIEIAAQTPDPNAISPSRLPHMFFLHNPDVHIENIHVNGLGRTDKTRRIVEPVEVVSGGPAVNPRGRYALHFHHTGVNPAIPPRIVRGSSLENGPGWGYVNHQSNVIMEDNFAHNLAGASFVTEDGNEIGAFRRNLSIGNIGMTNVPGVTNADQDVRARADIHDFGHTGNGYWLQGPGVELSDNIANATAGPAFAIFTASNKVLFDAVNLDNPEMAGGQKAIPVEAAPLKGFARNLSYGVQGSWDLWFTNPALPSGQFVIDGFTSWSQRLVGIVLNYSNDVLLKDILLVGDLSYPIRGANENPTYGLLMNSGMENVTIENANIVGFDIGISVTYRNRTTIRDTTIAAITAINVPETLISKSRILDVASDVVLTPLTPLELKGRLQAFYSLNGSFRNLYQGNVDYGHLTHGAVTTPSDMQVYLPGVGRVKLYFTQQQATYVPYSTSRSAAETAAVLADVQIKPEYRNKTNAELWSQYGFAYGMDIAPTVALPLGTIVGGLYVPL